MVYQDPNYPKPNNNLALAIFCTACCCLPAGVYAIIKANDVNNYYNMGQYELAEDAAAQAKKWSLIGIGASAVICVLYILLYVVLFIIASAS